LVLDPFGNLPFFAAALESVDRSRHTRVILRELLIALAVLVAIAVQMLMDGIRLFLQSI